MEQPKLFMLLLGCKPKGRLTEQHDVFFGIAFSLKELVPYLNSFWPEAKGNLHIDAWREVTSVSGYKVRVVPGDKRTDTLGLKLFLINLGGYKAGEFEEFHYKLLTVVKHKDQASQQAKQELFYKHTGFKGAPSHIDDTYGLDVDDLYEIPDILMPAFKSRYSLEIVPGANETDEAHLGYLPLWKIKA